MSTTAEKNTKDPNPLMEMLLCIVLPTFLLTKGTKHIGRFIEDEIWGPRAVLIIALALPIGYGLWDLFRRKKFNLFAVLGIIGVMATGFFGLGGARAEYFAAKEALMPLLFAAAILLSHLGKSPLIKSIFFNPQIFAVKRIEKAVEERGTNREMNSLLFRGSLGLGAVLCVSSVANWFLAMHFVGGKEPGSDEYVEAIGKTIGWGFAILTVPLLLGMLGVFWYLMKGMTEVTGLDSTELQEEGKTVKRKHKPTASPSDES